MKSFIPILSKPLSPPDLSLSADGYVRLSWSELQQISMQHLCSGLDEAHASVSHEGACVTEISGYTEWVSLTNPVLSVGWGWRIGLINQVVMQGLSYSNIMLFDQHNQDYGSDKSQRLLAEWILTLDWQEKTKSAINQVYS